MKTGRVLICLRDRQQFRFTKKFSHEADARRKARRQEPAWDADTRVSGQVGQEQIIADIPRSDIDINFLHQFRHVLNQQISNPLRLQILDGGNESRAAKHIGPRILDLAHEQIVLIAARQLVKCRRPFRAQDKGNVFDGLFRQLDRNQFCSERFQNRQRG